jgi:hypothetical protein
MATVLVINPYAADFKLYDEWMHPLGLYSLITLLKDKGIVVRFFNCLSRDSSVHRKKYGTGEFHSVEIEKPPLYRSIPRKYKLYGRPQKELAAFLQPGPAPDLICVGSMMTYWLPGVAETVKIITSVFPDVPVLVGGVAARLMPEAVTKMVRGIAIGGSCESRSMMRLYERMASLINKDDLSFLGGLALLDKPLHAPVLMSLGCPMACSYCASSQLMGKYRLRPPERVMDEIIFCSQAYGIEDFAFYDDALLFDAGNGILPFLKGIETRRLTLRFHTPNALHLRFVDDKVAETMKAMGFTTIRFGYESGAAGFGEDTSAKATRKEMKEKISSLEKAGFDKSDIGVYIMAGLEDQKPGQVIDEVEFVTSLGVRAKPVYLSPVPGTRLFERYAATFPQLRTDPLWHNDMFFITQLPGWDWEAVEMIRAKVYECSK